jgi:hypothetical protein
MGGTLVSLTIKFFEYSTNSNLKYFQKGIVFVSVFKSVIFKIFDQLYSFFFQEV